MAIAWHANKPPRWAGKIRAGSRDEKTKKLSNTPHFLLHDVPELIPVLGDNPTEIYFTVYSDDPEVFFPTDLRMYNSSELICKSMHGQIDPKTGQSMGTVAAFFKNDIEVEGLSQKPFPGIQRARVRRCSQACPDLVSGNCSEHFFLRMMIPHFSMGAIYVLDNTSFLGMQNLQSVFQLASYRLDGKLAGEIFRLYKRKEEGHYMKENGQRGKTEINVVNVEYVKFEEYEKKFKEKTDSIDWAKLVSARKRNVAIEQPILPAPDDVVLLEGQDDGFAAPAAQLPESPAAVAQSNEEALKARANDPSVAKYFAEIAQLLGKENSEELRMKTAERYSLADLITYLQGRIKEEKKKVQSANKQATAAKAPPAQPPPKAEAAPVDRPLF